MNLDKITFINLIPFIIIVFYTLIIIVMAVLREHKKISTNKCIIIAILLLILGILGMNLSHRIRDKEWLKQLEGQEVVKIDNEFLYIKTHQTNKEDSVMRISLQMLPQFEYYNSGRISIKDNKIIVDTKN